MYNELTELTLYSSYCNKPIRVWSCKLLNKLYCIENIRLTSECLMNLQLHRTLHVQSTPCINKHQLYILRAN